MKKILVVAVLCLLGATGAFADWALGINGALYMDEKAAKTSRPKAISGPNTAPDNRYCFALYMPSCLGG